MPDEMSRMPQARTPSFSLTVTDELTRHTTGQMKGDPEMGEGRDDAQLIEQHLPLVNHVVLQVAVHFPRYVDRQELARAGALGLVEAARRFDETRGVPFDRFAARRIRGAILDCCSLRRLGAPLGADARPQARAGRAGARQRRRPVAVER